MLIQSHADGCTVWDGAQFLSFLFGFLCCCPSYFRVSFGSDMFTLAMAHYLSMSMHIVGVKVSSFYVDHQMSSDVANHGFAARHGTPSVDVV